MGLNLKNILTSFLLLITIPVGFTIIFRFIDAFVKYYRKKDDDIFESTLREIGIGVIAIYTLPFLMWLFA
ncbi:MAG: hypothetical protein ACOCQR_00195 [bacterium]